MHFINETSGCGNCTAMLLNADIIDDVQYYDADALIVFEHMACGFPMVYAEVNGNTIYEQEHYGTCNRKKVFIEGLNALFRELKRQGVEWRF